MTVEVNGTVKIVESSAAKVSETITETISSVTEFVTTTIVLDMSAIDVPLPLAQVSPTKFVLLKASGTIGVKIDGAASATDATKVMWVGAVDTIEVSNPSDSQTVTVTMIVGS